MIYGGSESKVIAEDEAENDWKTVKKLKKIKNFKIFTLSQEYIPCTHP